MKESCVVCQAAMHKADGVSATLVLLFTLTGDVPVARVVEALCKKHGAQLDRMVYSALVPPSPQPPQPLRRKRKKAA
jgi:hypothetical protein